MLLKGGFTVQPVPAPTSTCAELIRRNNDGGRSQKLILFNETWGLGTHAVYRNVKIQRGREALEDALLEVETQRVFGGGYCSQYFFSFV